MDSVFIQAVVDDLRARTRGAQLGKVWQPSEHRLVLDLRLADERFLLVSTRPTEPELFLTSRSIAELEPEGSAERAFAALLRKRLRGALLERIGKHPDDRIATLTFSAFGPSGDVERLELLIALTGRSANVYLVDQTGAVAGTLKPVPAGASPPALPDETWFASSSNANVDDPSRVADERAQQRDATRALTAARGAIRSRARAALGRAERLQAALEQDIEAAEGHERDRELGESLLAQILTARVERGAIRFNNLYDENGIEVEVPCDEGDTPQRVAERLFVKHRKAKRTRERSSDRLNETRVSIETLTNILREIDGATTLADLAETERTLDAALGMRRAGARERAPAPGSQPTIKGARRFVSSDGYEILVGRSSSANDALTFKTAKPSDLWLHAADYPGSHVVVRNPIRTELPPRTLREAAQLAAFYSEAGKNALVDVRYTERKFVSKPRGAKAGLVRISRFKTISVAPAAEIGKPSA